MRVKRRVGEFVLMMRHILTVPVTYLERIRLVKTTLFLPIIFLLHVSLRILSAIQMSCMILLIQLLVSLVVLLFIEFMVGKIVLLEGAGGWRDLVEKLLAQLGFEFRPTTKLLIPFVFRLIHR